MMRNAVVLAALATCALLYAAPACTEGDAVPKKLIQYGWGIPTPGDICGNIREMEQRPFDGLIFTVPGMGRVFMLAEWDEEQVESELKLLREIEWRKFTDNFLIMWAASDMDWFSDGDWEIVLRNVGLMAQAAVAGRCKGLCFDAEPYGDNPWSYANALHGDERSFAEYQAQARKRGAEFMHAITEHMPDVVLHTFFQLSYFADIATEPDAVRREELLSREHYALLPAFLNGMLDAAGPEAVITDGNESAYYYTDPCSYYRAYHQMRQTVLPLVAPENVRKYQAQVQVSQALYVDQVFNLRQGMLLLSSVLSPDERAQWFEQDVYYALATADEYVWCYSERMNWWDNGDIPRGLTEAIESARRKLANREPLGYDMSDMLDDAHERLREGLEAKIIRRSADIPARPAGTPAPVIDGNLNEPVWRATRPREPFLPYVTNPNDTVQAATTARVTYDEENLYIALQCEEPEPGAMRILGEKRDDTGVWLGDSVDIFLSVGEGPTPFIHLILNAAGVKWDAYCTEGAEDLGFNPEWESAVAIGDSAWFAEVALPWSEMKVSAPAPGDMRRAQLGRQRIPGREHSTWSKVFDRFVAPRYFGRWVFQARSG
ncbi:MAG: hypothetical protein JSV65_07355 [Armatimonadota bacterium]|nr:MAG: hypothetical protein JSV65_07355 [Armatimonadota bacterium]